MLEGLDRREKGIVGGILLIAIALSFIAGSYAGGGVTGNIAASGGSEQAVRDAVQQVIDRQMQRQQQQLQAAVNRSENLTADDVSIAASIESVEQSQFAGLYKVTISITGEVPNRFGTGTRAVDQTQTVYVSEDGRYLFREPTDLQQPRQPAGRQGGPQPAPQ